MIFEENLIEKLRIAKHTVFFTGSGVSNESGLPTFRDNQDGIYLDFNPNVFASIEGFISDPKRVWKWYSNLRKLISNLEPNKGHYVIANWGNTESSKVTVITQNVDNFHQRAGSQDIIELHGNITMEKCLKNGHQFVHDNRDYAINLPSCKKCNSLVRPDVLWFDETLNGEIFNLAEQVACKCNVFICIGSSMNTYPESTLPLKAKRNGAYLVQINPHPTALDQISDYNIRGKSAEVLSELYNRIFQTP